MRFTPSMVEITVIIEMTPIITPNADKVDRNLLNKISLSPVSTELKKFIYSHRRASIGFNLEALIAGKIPKNIPTTTARRKAIVPALKENVTG